MTEEIIRNLNMTTTGDFAELEYFRDGEWRPAAISGTALRLMNGPGTLKQDAVIISENHQRIWRALAEMPLVEGKRPMLTSDHV